MLFACAALGIPPAAIGAIAQDHEHKYAADYPEEPRGAVEQDAASRDSYGQRHQRGQPEDLTHDAARPPQTFGHDVSREGPAMSHA